MIDHDLQFSTSLGQTTIDAAAAGWLVYDYLISIDEDISCKFTAKRISFGRLRPFCVLEPRADHIDCRLRSPQTGRKRYRLASMADLTPALQQHLRSAALAQAAPG